MWELEVIQPCAILGMFIFLRKMSTLWYELLARDRIVACCGWWRNEAPIRPWCTKNESNVGQSQQMKKTTRTTSTIPSRSPPHGLAMKLNIIRRTEDMSTKWKKLEWLNNRVFKPFYHSRKQKSGVCRQTKFFLFTSTFLSCQRISFSYFLVLLERATLVPSEACMKAARLSTLMVTIPLHE